ncbi:MULTISPECIES: hypothetical protein [unclassified Nostoc]|uniref:hypothetical protein n=1 Tax=unclassified Nostoc TaxID=2593658 RepID=UPI002601A0B2|nr:hypothetical protein [Nostoc sp. S13]MDF5736782.1 hypothetical protein [Nostoc sp. S13]
MINEPDYSDPAYWASQGIEIIVIDSEDQESVNAGFEQIGQRLQQALSEIKQADDADF